MGAKSKRKGNSGERELAKHLSEIFQAPFIRSDNSGAFVGGKNAVRKTVLSEIQQRVRKADIIPPDHLPHLVIECKAYCDFRFHQLLQPGPCPVLDTWIKQTLDILDPHDAWFVCFKISLRGWYVAVPDAACSDYQFENHCIYTGSHGRFYVTDLLSFFRTNREMILKKAGPQSA